MDRTLIIAYNRRRFRRRAHAHTPLRFGPPIGTSEFQLAHTGIPLDGHNHTHAILALPDGHNHPLWVKAVDCGKGPKMALRFLENSFTLAALPPQRFNS